MVQKVACDDRKSLSVNPAVNRDIFDLGTDKAAERRGMGSASHQLCPRYSGTPH